MSFQHRAIRPHVKLLATGLTIPELGGRVVSLQTSKSLKEMAGMFEMTIVPTGFEGEDTRTGGARTVKALSEIYATIKPMDLISIGFTKPDGCMLGIVDNVFKSKTLIGKSYRRSIKLRGRDFGKALIEDSISYAPTPSSPKADEYSAEIIERLEAIGIEEPTKHPLSQYWQRILAPEQIDQDSKGIGPTWMGVEINDGMDYILNNVTSMRINMELAGKAYSAGQILFRPETIKTRDEVIVDSGLHTMDGNSIVNFMRRIIDKDFYEMWVDSIASPDGIKAILMLRPKPFDRDWDMVADRIDGVKKKVCDSIADAEFTWDKLKTFVDPEKEYHTVRDSDVLQLNVGRSDYEAYSMYKLLITKQILGVAVYTKYGIIYPVIDFDALKKYGLREKFVTCNLFHGAYLPDRMTVAEKEHYKQAGFGDYLSVYVDGERAEDVSLPIPKPIFLNELRWRRDRIVNWYRPNPLFESGPSVIRGNEDIRIGDRIYYADEYAINGKKGVMFYIVNAANRWRFGGAFTTSLALIRGSRDEIIKKHFEDTDADILEFNV